MSGENATTAKYTRYYTVIFPCIVATYLQLFDDFLKCTQFQAICAHSLILCCYVRRKWIFIVLLDVASCAHHTYTHTHTNHSISFWQTGKKRKCTQKKKENVLKNSYVKRHAKIIWFGSCGVNDSHFFCHFALFEYSISILHLILCSFLHISPPFARVFVALLQFRLPFYFCAKR